MLSKNSLSKKHGLGSTVHQRYRCQDCCRSFQLDYEHYACQLVTKDKNE
ncbi:TPA: IS1/IS1595 family N-terminal zinc-binding domain-containing protein [Providencia alcalifaciens]|nr:hypothetical protein NVI2019_PLFLNFOB_03961 [Providencia alcalifaciens]CAG9435835.1 hypothetical protein NVI2019_ANGEOOBF_03962 [Providencia alcalifaciens]CAG9435840.1 hypothetical protein NVI2019_KOLGMIGM_03963 [Providencia alcalifaciens]CAG9435851.1 hypothetical protein NVI2019_OGMBKCAO_03968 [Providencia alcalifaciens]CAG9435893.1 hypothetical protein NVI2019_PEGOAJLN_03802 [Providencia alcalifaciens]